MDKREFATFAMAMRTYYPKEQILPNQQAMELWWQELQDIPAQVADAALRKWVATSKWSPSIAEIREMAAEVQSGDIPDWGSGWKQVQAAIKKFGREYPKSAVASLDSITGEAVEQMGWWNLCISENPLQDMNKFRVLYEAIAQREKKSKQLSLPLQNTIKQIQMEQLDGLLQIGGVENE